MHPQPQDTLCTPLGALFSGGASAWVPYTSKLRVMSVSGGTPAACGSKVHVYVVAYEIFEAG
jgi:hypothetical protein